MSHVGDYRVRYKKRSRRQEYLVLSGPQRCLARHECGLRDELVRLLHCTMIGLAYLDWSQLMID